MDDNSRKYALLDNDQSCTYLGFCMFCRIKRYIQKPQLFVMRNGKSAVSGHCPVCGRTIVVIVK